MLFRNAIAHSFFPENVKKPRAEWKGKSIFALEGIERFVQDMLAVGLLFASIRKGRY